MPLSVSGKNLFTRKSQLGGATASTIDIDGLSDIGADIADADLIIIDDGGGGTNRKSAVTRIPTYVFTALSLDEDAMGSNSATKFATQQSIKAYVDARSVTVSDGSSSTAITLGSTMTFAGTSNEVTVAESSGTVTIGLPDDVTIAGDLVVNGDTVTVNTATLSVEDPLILLGNGNGADSVDLGLYAKYTDSGVKYAGFFRDASDSDKWKLFATTGNSHEAPTTTVNTTSGFTLGTLVVDSLEGTITTAAQTNITSIGTIATGTWEATDIAVAHGGTGVSTLTDGGVLLGSGTGAITAMAVLADGEMIVGDGTTDPVAESGATLRTSIGIGTGDSPQLTGIELGHASDTTIVRASSGDITIEGNAVYRAGGTDVPVADGGTGASSLTDGGVLLGSGTGAVTAMAVLADGEMIVGDGTTDPVAESGATLRTSIGVGTGDSPQLTGIELGHASDTTIVRASSGDITIEGNAVYRAGGTDVPVADGGTGASSLTANGVLIGNGTSAIASVDMSTKGHILIGDGSGNPSMLAIGTNDYVLTADSSEATGVKWAAAASGGMTAWILEDDDGTEVSISNAEEVKFIGAGITTNWTDTSHGSDGDPFDLTFTVDAAQTGITSIYATDLILGEDAETAIDFGTANEIDFKADNAARLTLSASALYPVTNNQIDLGTSSLEFKDAFFDGTVTADAFAGPLTGNVTGNASGTAATVTGAAQTNITSLGTLTALTVDDVAVDGKVITMTGSSSDTAVFTAGTNGTLSIVTTDAAAAAANIQITADGTVDIDSAGVLTLDSGAAINIEPASGSAILLDGTISIDAGVVTGATSITSTAFVGDITGDVTGTADVATVATTVTITDNESTNENNAVIFTAGGDVDGGNLGLESDGNLTYNPSNGTLTATAFSGALTGNVTGTADVATVATTVTITDNESTDESNAIIFTAGGDVDGGNIGLESDGTLTYNPSTGVVTATGFAGALTGNVTGNASGTAATVTGAAQTNITSLGTLTALTVDDVAVNGKVITMTGSSSDTAVMTVAANGAFSLVTTDAAAAAANVQITADGTVDIDSAGVLTLDSGAAINIEPASGSAILLDGTISIDAGVVTGATSITSTAFVGDITGDVTGTADVATVATTVTITDNESTNENNAVIFTAGGDVDGGNLGLESDGNLTYNPSSGTLTATAFSGALTGNVTGNASGTAATVTGAAQTNITSLGTLTALTVDDVAVNGKVITMTGSTDDTAVMTVATNGALTIETTDTAAAAANIQITADGTAELAGTTVTLDSAGAVVLDSATGIINIQDAGSTVLSITEGNSGDVTVKLETNAKDLVFTDNGDATNMKILDAAAGINVPGEVQTTGIGYTDGDNALTIADGGGITVAQDLTMTADKSLNLPQGAKVTFTDAITDDSIDDHDAQGIIFTFTAGATVTPFSPVYLHSDNEVREADSSAIATMPCIGVSINTSDVTDGNPIEVMLMGLIRDETFSNFTAGSILYVSTAVGELTNTIDIAAEAENEVIQVVGHAIGQKLVFIQPCLTTLEHGA